MTPPADGGSVGVLLAGGASRRFGSDKMLVELDGVSLPRRAAETMIEACDAVIAVLSTTGELSLPSQVRVVRDARPHEGPLAGLLAGLEASGSCAVALVVGGDMPWLHLDVARQLVAAVVADDGIAVAALEDGGRPRPLPIAVRVPWARAAAARLLGAGERRLRALLDEGAVHVIPARDWRAADPEGASLRDVDTPADLPAPPPRVG